MMRNIPSLLVSARTLPEAYEKALVEVWSKGLEIKTEYDKSDEPPSRDATVMVEIREPFAEPRFHRGIIDGPQGVAKYIAEVILGVHDHRIKPYRELMQGAESKDTRWTYTYHQRLCNYRIGEQTVDQIAYMVEKLSQSGYSRRAQAVTWNQLLDPPTDDPPCLQRVWGRIVEDNGELYFNMNTHWRSRDLFKAWFENVIALTELQKRIAEQLSEKIGKEVKIGRYTDISDSLHIYGRDFRSEKIRPNLTGFLALMKSRTFEERTYTTDMLTPFFIEGLQELMQEEDMPKEMIGKIEQEIQRWQKQMTQV